jgi:hypothetical protein
LLATPENRVQYHLSSAGSSVAPTALEIAAACRTPLGSRTPKIEFVGRSGFSARARMARRGAWVPGHGSECVCLYSLWLQLGAARRASIPVRRLPDLPNLRRNVAAEHRDWGSCIVHGEGPWAYSCTCEDIKRANPGWTSAGADPKTEVGLTELGCLAKRPGFDKWVKEETAHYEASKKKPNWIPWAKDR